MTSDDAELAELLRWNEENQQRIAADSPKPLRTAVKAEVSRIASRPTISDEELEARNREREQRERRRELGDRVRSLIASRGERYAHCTLENYRATTPEQNAALATLMDFVGEMGRLIRKEGEGGLILYGPRGTGKDHLLFALMRQAVEHSELSVKWLNGMDLLGMIRDRISKGEEEAELIRKLTAPDVLAISDPLPPFGSLTEFQATMLFRVIDARYSRRKPVWVTVNVASRSELDERMGPQLVDRLIDGSLVVSCNWPSYRSVRKKQ